jgi:hypothetical protein
LELGSATLRCCSSYHPILLICVFLDHRNILQNAQTKKVKPLNMDSLEKLDKKGIYIGPKINLAIGIQCKKEILVHHP